VQFDEGFEFLEIVKDEFQKNVPDKDALIAKIIVFSVFGNIIDQNYTNPVQFQARVGQVADRLKSLFDGTYQKCGCSKTMCRTMDRLNESTDFQKWREKYKSRIYAVKNMIAEQEKEALMFGKIGKN